MSSSFAVVLSTVTRKRVAILRMNEFFQIVPNVLNLLEILRGLAY